MTDHTYEEAREILTKYCVDDDAWMYANKACATELDLVANLLEDGWSRKALYRYQLINLRSMQKKSVQRW